MFYLENGEEFELEHSLLPSAKFKINASIQRFDGRLFCAYRTDNLDKYDAKNFLTELDEDFSPISHSLLIPEDGNFAFEDVRLFNFNKTLMTIYTYLPRNELNSWDFRYGLGIGTIDTENGIIKRQLSLRKFSKNIHSKNWIPYIYENTLYLITDFQPEIRVLKILIHQDSISAEEINIKEQNTYSWDYGQIRGGSPFVSNPYDNSTWQYCFVHSHITLPNGNINTRFYVYTLLRICLKKQKMEYHRLPINYSKMEKSENYEKLWLSGSKNTAMKVVFPMGLINFKNGVLLSYGKDDCVSRLVYYDWDFLTSFFKN